MEQLEATVVCYLTRDIYRHFEQVVNIHRLFFALDKSSGLGEAHSGVLVRMSRGADVTRLTFHRPVTARKGNLDWTCE